MTKFQDLGLNSKTLKAISKLGYTDPTPVQEQTIPSILKGRNVVAGAQTGTGKTAAFVLPLIQRIQRAPRNRIAPQALIVTPTRELAAQIDKVARVAAMPYDYKVRTVIGGVKYGPQLERMRNGVDVLVATPGRLIDLMQSNHVDLSRVRILVLDEADRMLDMGFWPPVKQILGKLPDQCQKLLFSATIGTEVNKIVGTHMKDPVIVEIARKGVTADHIDQSCMPIQHDQKADLLLAVLDRWATGKVLIFTRTKRRADTVAKMLSRSNIKCQAIHGDRSQSQRTKTLDQFMKGRIDILVTTDVIARGIHVDNIDHVINYDVPAAPEDYVHRIGRTGRAGQGGTAITFVGPEEVINLRDIEFLMEKIVPAIDLEGFPYKKGRIVPDPDRPATKKKPLPFSGRRSRNKRITRR